MQAAVCTATGLPAAWTVETAKASETPLVPDLLDAMVANGFAPETCAMHKGYDACEARGVRPIVPLRQTPYVVAGKPAPPSCEHGVWTFAGADAKARRQQVPVPDR